MGGICKQNIDSLVQDYSNSSALTTEFLQSCTKSCVFYRILDFTVLRVSKWTSLKVANYAAPDIII